MQKAVCPEKPKGQARPLRILLDDGNQIQLGTGIGKYSASLYRAMKRAGCDVALAEPPTGRGGSRIRQRLRYIRTINSAAYRDALAKRCDVVLYTNYTIPLRRNRRVKYVGVISDMVAFLHPETLPPLYRLYNRAMIRNTLRKADLVLVPSRSVQAEVLAKFPWVGERLHDVWHGLHEVFRPLDAYAPYENERLEGIDDVPFFLFVSTVEKRKNVGLVIDAFIQLKRTDAAAKDYRLVIAGRPGFGYDAFVAQAEASEYRADIIFAGFTSDADCNRLYNHARAFIFPTMYEGFGFAQIECMSCHLPIILSDIPTNREISREYGLFFDLEEPATLVRQMQRIVQGDYDTARHNALADEYLRDFDWDRVARQYMALLDDLRD